jgi:hypothetical protein
MRVGTVRGLAAGPFLVIAASALACGSSARPPEAPTPEPEQDVAEASPKSGGPAIEYDLGGVDPNVLKSRLNALKSTWNGCYASAHNKHETLEGRLTFTLRTNKDGTVKWAFIKDSDLGSRTVEKCVIDSLKETNFGAPMDAKEGEVQAHTYGWELDEDTRAADPGAQGSVLPSIEKAKAKIDACRRGNGKMTATIYVAKGGKPLSVGVAVDDPRADESIDCVVDVLMSLKYVNKASWPTKVTVELP